jgi:hypothetical protein
MKSRNLLIRVLTAIGWLILIYFVSNMLIGGIVGGIAGAGTSGFEEGKVAGARASTEFFQEYGRFVLLGQVGVFSFLAFNGKLPGTTKFRNNESA